jgi:hypothetical protein
MWLSVPSARGTEVAKAKATAEKTEVRRYRVGMIPLLRVCLRSVNFQTRSCD